MNDLQRKVFELLQLFVDICDKWSIPYYLVCGSALGAVKYGGFIPWDDDIDVGLLREDYQRFLEVAPNELPEWCFLQNYKTENNYPHTFSKLRNSNTAFIEENVKHLPINHGIYLDIFPIDGHPTGRIDRMLFAIRKKMGDWIRFSVVEDYGNTKVQNRNRILRFLGVNKWVLQAQIDLENLYASYPARDSEFWCNYGNWQGKLDYAPKWHYGKGTWSTFEGMQVRIPENYDAYLTQKYGDWKADLAVELQKSHHHCVVIDTEHTYKNYMVQSCTSD